MPELIQVLSIAAPHLVRGRIEKAVLHSLLGWKLANHAVWRMHRSYFIVKDCPIGSHSKIERDDWILYGIDRKWFMLDCSVIPWQVPTTRRIEVSYEIVCWDVKKSLKFAVQTLHCKGNCSANSGRLLCEHLRHQDLNLIPVEGVFVSTFMTMNDQYRYVFRLRSRIPDRLFCQRNEISRLN
jgi:hypothetical protein